MQSRSPERHSDERLTVRRRTAGALRAANKRTFGLVTCARMETQKRTCRAARLVVRD
jgi:hypothetical protein